MTKLILTTVALSLANVALSQTGWKIDYKASISTSMNGSTPTVAWLKQNFDGATSGDLGQGANPSAFLQGNPFRKKSQE